MQVLRGHSGSSWESCAVAIGNFDGVHAGHRALVAQAHALGSPAVVLTFDPHPNTLFGTPPAKLCSLERRLELLEAAGADAVVVEPFTRELAACAAELFVDEVLLASLKARAIVVGYDFSYGAHRAGSIDTLREHAARADVALAIVQPVEVDGEVASSTRIRAHLLAGDVPAANRLLGRRWDVDGLVVHGAKRGRAIGIPTANIAPRSDLAIAPGIYACTLDGMPAVASLGTNPTFVEQGGLVLEVHVLDWDGDIYDRVVRIAFAAKLRDEARYDSIDALLAQIRIDIEHARVTLRRDA